MDIIGKTVLITGASSGIGEAIAKTAAAKGARVLLLARSTHFLKRVASEITAQRGMAIPFTVDLSDAAAVAAVAVRIIAEEGVPDIIVNNAGAGRWLSVAETGPTEVAEMMAAPYFAAFNLTREFLPEMIRRGSGRIVNVSSVASRLSWPGAAAYIAARWAINGFSNALRTEVQKSGLTVTLALFGSVSSTFWLHNPGSRERLPMVNKFIPELTPDQAAQAIVRGIERNAREVIKPVIFRFIFFLNGLFPRTTEMILRLGWRAPETGHADVSLPDKTQSNSGEGN